MSEIAFTGKVGARKMCLMKRNRFETRHDAYYPTLELADGQKVTIKDDTSPVGLMNADTRYKAIKKGKEVLERMQAIGIKGGRP